MEIKNKNVFLRADFNVPIKDGIVKNDYRIKATIETLKYLKDQNCKTIIVSHIETADVDRPTLKPVFEYLQKNNTELNINFLDNVEDVSNIEEKFSEIKNGEFLLLENIRNLKGEKDNDEELAKSFRSMTDFYINDAFAVSHREHMSVSALPKLFSLENKMFGLQMKKEIDSLSKILNPEKPFIAILSGAKFSTKLPLIEKYLKTADNLFVGGALYNNIIRSLGYNVGVSLIDEHALYIDEMIKTDDFKNKVFIPQNVIVKNIDTQEIKNKNINNIDDKETVQDISEESISNFINILKDKNIKTIVWNGPLGNYEDNYFKNGTEFIAKGLISIIENNINSHLYIGGGDTVAAINGLNIKNDRIFVSTGGGAMLEFLEKDGKLPGVVSVTG